MFWSILFLHLSVVVEYDLKRGWIRSDYRRAHGSMFPTAFELLRVHDGQDGIFLSLWNQFWAHVQRWVLWRDHKTKLSQTVCKKFWYFCTVTAIAIWAACAISPGGSKSTLEHWNTESKLNDHHRFLLNPRLWSFLQLALTLDPII